MNFSLMVNNYAPDDYNEVLLALCKSHGVLCVTPRRDYVHAEYASYIDAAAAALDSETSAYCKTSIRSFTVVQEREVQVIDLDVTR